MMVEFMCFCFCSCSDDEPVSPSVNTNDDDDGLNLNDYNKKLIDTSWRLEKMIHYNYNNTKSTSYKYNGVIEFSKDLYTYKVDLSSGYSYTNTEKKMYLDGVHVGYWEYDKEGLSMFFKDEWEEQHETFSYGATYMSVTINGSALTLIKSYPDVNSRYVWTYSLVRRGDYNIIVNSNTNNDNNGGSSGKGDVPYITEFTFTATKSSITVKFMATEKPTSATIKYGETSATTKTLSSTIINKQISATANGLKSGTKYYFKCTVKNSFGSSTSDVFPAITNY